MTPLHSELDHVGHRLNRWRAEVRAFLWIAAILVTLGLCTVLDFIFRYDRTGRLVLWGFLVALVAGWLVHVWLALSRRWTVESVAARVEKTFPLLDNHLINFVQFESRGGKDKLESAYLQRGVPEWRQVNVDRMKDKRLHRRSALVLAVSGLLLAAPAFWSAHAWTNAMLRVLNPFSGRPPATLALIRAVDPGNKTVLQGSAVILSCKADGKRGQAAWIDVAPADDKKSATRIGALSGGKALEEFAFRIPQATMDTRYRFRVGDSTSPWFKIHVRPPLALSKMRLTVTPPEYAKIKAQEVDGLSAEPAIPYGSTVGFALSGSYPLKSASFDVDGKPVSMASADEGKTWTGSITLTQQKDIRFNLKDIDGYALESHLKYQLQPDQAPTIRVIMPTGRTVLSPGAVPRIQWEAMDDYGLSSVTLEKITVGTGGEVSTEKVGDWKPAGERSFATLWSGESAGGAGQTGLVFRIVAVDTFPDGQPHRVESPLIAFDLATGMQTADRQKKSDADAAATLEKLINLQSENRDRTVKLDSEMGTAKRDQWKEAATIQGEIQQIAGRLLTDRRKPLGAMTPALHGLYQREMPMAVNLLTEIPGSQTNDRPVLSRRAIVVENTILQVLTTVNLGADRVKQHREVTGLLALLDALVQGQDDTMGKTAASAKSATPVEWSLVEKQDSLSADVADFVKVCRKEAENLELADAQFAKIVTAVGNICETKKVSSDMTRAAERLEAKVPKEALPFQEQALATLRECQDMMNQWRTDDATKKLAALRDAVAEAKDKLNKLAKIQSKVVDSTRSTGQQKDMSKKEFDEMQEEQNQLDDKIKDAALDIAKDLHIFPELPVGNDLVNDISTIYEEAKQVPGSDKTKTTELGLQKEDDILKTMEKAKGRMDDMEMWLASTPDAKKRNTENFDQKEMPKMAALPMPTELQDLVGDLLKQEEDEKKKADDSATNQGSPDLPAGWGVGEGETVSYAAKGKSGNETPDHKEQDGRSLIGRQGMSDGESAAGSGRVREGDDKIEKRRTQDSAQSGQVQEEGHSEAKATGGGKLSGYASEMGMPGMGPRRDAQMAGSELGMQAMLRKQAESLYAKASLMHIRTGSLDEAIENMRHAEEAMANGNRIQQVREFQKRSIAALRKTQAELGGGVMTESIDLGAGKTPVDDQQMAGAADEAPANYRDLVADYFKSLSQGK